MKVLEVLERFCQTEFERHKFNPNKLDDTVIISSKLMEKAIKELNEKNDNRFFYNKAFGIKIYQYPEVEKDFVGEIEPVGFFNFYIVTDPNNFYFITHNFLQFIIDLK